MVCHWFRTKTYEFCGFTTDKTTFFPPSFVIILLENTKDYSSWLTILKISDSRKFSVIFGGFISSLSSKILLLYCLLLMMYSLYLVFFFFREKSESYLCFWYFQKIVENQFSSKIKFFNLMGEASLWSYFVHHLENSVMLHYLSCIGIPNVWSRKNTDILWKKVLL